MNIFKKYTNTILNLHEMIANNLGDSDGADKLRDLLDELTYKLSDEEKQMVEHMAGDLYMIYDRGLYFSIPTNYTLRECLHKLALSLNNGYWDESLELLRYSLGISEWLIALYRGYIWYKFGNENIALKYYQYANKLNPDVILDDPFGAIHISKLKPDVVNKQAIDNIKKCSHIKDLSNTINFDDEWED